MSRMKIKSNMLMLITGVWCLLNSFIAVPFMSNRLGRHFYYYPIALWYRIPRACRGYPESVPLLQFRSIIQL